MFIIRVPVRSYYNHILILKKGEKVKETIGDYQAQNKSGAKIVSQLTGHRKQAPTVMQVLPAMEVGGAEQAVIDISAELANAGAKSLIVCNGGPRLHDISRVGGHHINLPVDSKNPVQMVRNIGRIRKLIRDYDVDIVHARSRAPAWSCYFACKHEDVPFVTTCHAPYNISGALKRAYNSVMAKGDRVIAISDYVADYLRKNYKIDENRLNVIYRGIPLEIYHPTTVSPERMIQISKSWRLPDEANIVLLPGRLTRLKGQHVLIEAMSMVKNKHAFAVILGSDQGRKAYRKELEDMVSKYGLENKIRLVDHCRDMPAAYMLSTIVISASTDPEGFGRVPVEAMAMGRIPIATDHGAAKETVLSGETGWLIPPGNATALAAAIDRSLDMDETERVKMATRGMARAQDLFSREQMVDQTFRVYADVLKN